MRHALAIAAFAATFALAPGASAAGSGGASAEKEADGRVIEAQNLVVPVVREGRLVNYLFATVRVELNPAGDIWRVKERSHFLRDSLLRAAHRAQLADPASDTRLNEAEALRVFQVAAAEALGARAVRQVTITDVSSLSR